MSITACRGVPHRIGISQLPPVFHKVPSAQFRTAFLNAPTNSGISGFPEAF